VDFYANTVSFVNLFAYLSSFRCGTPTGIRMGVRKFVEREGVGTGGGEAHRGRIKTS